MNNNTHDSLQPFNFSRNFLGQLGDTPQYGHSTPLVDGFESPPFHSASISSGTSSHSSLFSRSSSHLSLDSNNSSTYMRLENQLEESKQHIHALEQQNHQLARDREFLAAKLDTLQGSFITLSNSLGCNPQDPPTIPALDDVDKELSPANFPSIKFWTRSKWSQHLHAEKSVTKLGLSASTCGSSRLAKGENVACLYIKGADGVPVDGNLKLPSGWSQVALDVKQTFYHTIRLNFVEFRYCSDNWKADLLATHNYLQWYKYHITNGKKHTNTDSSSSHSKKQKVKEIPLEDEELEYVDSPTSTTSELPIVSTMPVKPDVTSVVFNTPTIPILATSELPIESTWAMPVEPNVISVIFDTPTIPITATNPTSLDNLIDPVLKVISNHSSSDLLAVSDAVAKTTAVADPAIANPTHINTPEVPPASFVPQVKNPLRLNSRVAGVSGTFRQTPSSSSTPSIPATPIPIPAIPSIPATLPTLPIIPVTAETPAPPTTNAKSKPKPHPVKLKTPAVPKAPNAPNKAKAMHIQKTINAWNLCAAAWKAAGNLLGTAKQFKGYWEQLPTVTIIPALGTYECHRHILTCLEEKSKALVISAIQLPSYPLWNRFSPIARYPVRCLGIPPSHVLPTSTYLCWCIIFP
ncbi:hypothetical protein DFJ58DRAFT_725139 [Suillus subalutaceus]|uniref:uncharacterized protein n=1 Tax=Suillus subalutaceus TaxID=48586 RepID=UPI001B877691|nr:uncharacterized protein DFJ58DRAFT_725139 [Suillus subalutaceus]KAG1863237.1 hypothetical protein DFJ58DRAFT_725139 [Suillus subalutaceus]